MTKNDIISLGATLEREQEAAFDLWSWLPCSVFAERGHGDYACEFRWPHEDELRGVIHLLAYLAGGDNLDTVEDRSLFGCPCEECEVPSKDEVVEVINSLYRKEPK